MAQVQLYILDSARGKVERKRGQMIGDGLVEHGGRVWAIAGGYRIEGVKGLVHVVLTDNAESLDFRGHFLRTVADGVLIISGSKLRSEWPTWAWWALGVEGAVVLMLGLRYLL